jgi:hypothetical protein
VTYCRSATPSQLTTCFITLERAHLSCPHRPSSAPLSEHFQSRSAAEPALALRPYGVYALLQVLGRGRDAVRPFDCRFSRPRPPNRTCPLAGHPALHVIRWAQVRYSLTCPTKATSSWLVRRKRAPSGSTSSMLYGVLICAPRKR